MPIDIFSKNDMNEKRDGDKIRYDRCAVCGLTAVYAGADIDENGRCRFCRSFKKRELPGADKLKEDVALAEGEKLGVTVSGGKDSIYMWSVLVSLFGAQNVTAFMHYRPGITSTVALENVRKTSEILGSEAVVLTDNDAYERFRINLGLLLEHIKPELVRVLLCAGCRYGITGRLYAEGTGKGIRKYFSAASYLELAPFKEELIAARSESGDLDDGFEVLMAECPWMEHGDNVSIIRRDHRLKYKSNDNAKRLITAEGDVELFDFDDYFENDPDEIEKKVTERLGWKKTSRSWHFDCEIEDIKDIFYYGLLGYTELDFRTAAMARYGLVSREESIRIVEDEALKISYSYYKMLELLRKHRLGHLVPQMDSFYRESSFLKEPADIHDYQNRTIHMIGIGGASMCGIAKMLTERGYTVTGSDRSDGDNLRTLRSQGIKVTAVQRAENVHGCDLAVYSMAIPEDHPELAECRRLGIPIIERSVLLGQISSEYGTSVAVCGTHGKTTVTSMLAQILVETGMDPTVHIGGALDAIGGNVRTGDGDIFLTEACEYRRNFMNVRSNAAILLDIDADHLDYYRDIDEIEKSFGDFLDKLPADGWALGNGDDERVRRQLDRLDCRTLTFGVSEDCDYSMKNAEEDARGYVSFDMYHGDELLGHVSMAVPGMFNAMDALAALAAAHHIGADIGKAIGAVGHFTGARRRFEKTGTLNGAELFHDYGHNPVEMRNAISIARKRCDGRLWAVIQPHTYSRVKTLFDEYLSCAEEADIVLVTDIFAAREPDPGDIDSEMLVSAMRSAGVNAVLTPGFEDAAAKIRNEAAEGDLVITLGCGDVYKLNEMLA